MYDLPIAEIHIFSKKSACMNRSHTSGMIQYGGKIKMAEKRHHNTHSFSQPLIIDRSIATC